MYEITWSGTFSAGHRIPNHKGGKGKCARLHGHTYHVDVSLVTDELDDDGFVVDFGEIKALVNEWDHRLLLWEDDPLAIKWGDSFPRAVDTPAGPAWLATVAAAETAGAEERFGVIRLPFVPTAENMADFLASTLIDRYENLGHVELTLHESPTTSATVARYRFDEEPS